MVQYKLENLCKDQTIKFAVTVFKDEKDKAFADDMTEETTNFVIENPIVS